jgi:phage-related protein (TIGR01555 family)
MNNRQRQTIKINPALTAAPPVLLSQSACALPRSLGGAAAKDKLAMDSAAASALYALGGPLGFSGEAPRFIGYGRLLALAQHGLIRAGVEMLADEMTGKWIKLNRAGAADADQNGLPDLLEALARLKARELFRAAVANCGYFGGCLIYLETDETGSDLVNPLLADEKTFAGKKIKGLKIIEPYNVTPGQYNSSQPWAATYYKPQVWHAQGVPVHQSRFLYFAMNALPSLLLPAYNFFGIPLAQSVLDAVSHFEECREAEARLLTKFSLTVLKTNMGDALAGGLGETLNNRVKFMTQNRDNDGVQVIDKTEEDIVTVTTPLAGVTDIVRQSMEMVAAYFGEPVTKMWGISPAGFNATGESDLKNHYEHIAGLQDKIIRPPLAKLLKFLQLQTAGRLDESVDFAFNSLSEDDETKKAAVAKTRAETAAIYIEAGIISPEEERSRLAADPESGYNDLDPYQTPEPADESDTFGDPPGGALATDGKEADETWVTINGTPVKIKDGELQGKIGEKIQAAQSQAQSGKTSRENLKKAGK